MRNACDTSAPPWPRPNGPGGPSAGAEGATPNGAGLRFGCGRGRPRALGLLPPARAGPAEDVLTQARLPWWSPCLPGRAPPARPPAGIRWRSASAMPPCPPRGAAHAGMARRYGVGGAPRPPRALPRVAGAAPRRPAGAPPLCRPWGLASVSHPRQGRRGWPCRYRPCSGRSPGKPPRPAGIGTDTWPDATIRLSAMDSVAWSAVVRVDAQAAGAPGPPAPMTPAVGAVRMRYGAPAVSAARRALPPRRSGTHAWGQPSAVS
jgi:hypothetical protein